MNRDYDAEREAARRWRDHCHTPKEPYVTFCGEQRIFDEDQADADVRLLAAAMAAELDDTPITPEALLGPEFGFERRSDVDWKYSHPTLPITLIAQSGDGEWFEIRESGRGISTFGELRTLIRTEQTATMRLHPRSE